MFRCWIWGECGSLFCVCVGMSALLRLHRDDCSSAVTITWARPRSDGRGEDLGGGMTQGWDHASLGPDFLFAGCRNFSPKSWRLGRGVIYHMAASIHSLCLALAPLLTAKAPEKAWNHLFSRFLLVFAGFLPGWRISGGVGGNWGPVLMMCCSRWIPWQFTFWNFYYKLILFHPMSH